MSKQLRMKMKRAIAGIVMITTIVWLSGVMALVPVASAATIVDGDVIKNPSAAGLAQFDVYIVKLVGTKKFKRLVLNPQVFASYGHLKWENVKSVAQTEMDSFKTSALVRVDGDAAQKVYALAPDNDTGAKSWANVTATQFVTEAAADPDSIYTINSTDAGNYNAVADITTVAQVTTFLTAGTLPSTTPVVPVTGQVTAALAADNPAAGTLASSSAYNTALKATITNGSSADVNVTGITVTRTGFSIDTNVAGVLVKDSAGARHGNVLTLADAKAALSFASDPIKVGAGKSETVSIQVNLGTTATSGTIGFKIGAAADITASTAVTGTFPLAGAAFTLVNGANTLGGISVQSQTISTSARSIDLGTTTQEIGKFKFSETSSKEAVNLKKVRFYNNGNSTDADLANINLYNTNTGASLATVAATTSKYVTFDLSASPLKLDKGTNKTLSVRADVVNGSTRTAQFIIQNDYDIEASGVDTGSGVLATVVANTDDGNATTFPVGSTTNFNTITIAAGTLSISKDASSPSGNVGQGQSNVTLGAWKLEAKGEDIQLQKATLDLSTGTSVATDFTGTVKLQTADGSNIYSIAVGVNTDDLWDGSPVQTSLATYYTIKAGTSVVLKIVADTAAAATNGATVQAKFGNVYYYKASSNTYATAQATVLAANTLTVNTAALTTAKNTAMGNSTVVAGQSAVKIGSYVLQAGSAEGVNVSTVNITLNSIDSSRLNNLKLFKGSTQLGSTVASPVASANAFSVGGSLTISASASETVDVFADIQTGSTATFTTSIAASGISANGTPSGTTLTTVPATAVTGQSITATSSGTLTLATDTATPVQAILHADQSGVEVARFKLSGTVEAIKVTKVILESTNGSGNMQGLALWDGATQVGTTSNLVDGKVTFSGLSLIVPKDGSKTVKVTVGTNSTGTMVSAQQVKLALASIEAVGNSSGVTVYPKSIYTTYSTSANETITANTASQAWTVLSTAGISVGDVLYVTLQAGTTNGSGFYVVDGVTNATTLAIRGDSASAATANLDSDGSSTGTVTRLATSTTTTVSAASAETITADTASQALTVASTSGFEPGDVVFVSASAGTTDGSGFYVVDSVTDATTLAISGRTLNAAGNIQTDGTVTGKVTKLVTGATTTVSTTSAETLTANTASALTVASTTGFAAGDLVFAEILAGTTNGSGFYVVDSVTNSTTLSLKGNRIGQASGNLVADGSVTGKVTKIGTTTYTTVDGTAAQTITANTASQALDVGSTTGFVEGDLLFVTSGVAGTTGSGFYVVNTNTDANTLAIVGQTTAGGNIITAATSTGKVSLITSSTGAGNPFYVHDVEPIVSLASGSPSGTSSGNSAQVVAKFAIKAEGSRDLTVKQITLTRGGNIGTRVATTAFPTVYLGGTSNLLASGDSWSGTTAGSTDAIVFTTPYTITAGDTVVFDVKVNTSSAQANDTFQVYIDGTSGSFGNLQWFYTAAPPAPGNAPTSSSPATVSDSYPIYGGTLSY